MNKHLNIYNDKEFLALSDKLDLELKLELSAVVYKAVSWGIHMMAKIQQDAIIEKLEKKK
jgi:hypothetical protein